mmetsp:Transcript_93850/g.268744  ORF Transcript_93850/g.268744 Transcript_93850/m.268744 type:complete len:258 (-) Transcript_93850:82-855(-)
MPSSRHRRLVACFLLLVATGDSTGTCTSNATDKARSRARADDHDDAPSVDEYHPHIEKCGFDFRPATIADKGLPVVLRGAATSIPAVGRWSPAYLASQFGEDETFHFDVAPPAPALNRTSALFTTFTFTPFMGGHGYAMEGLCRQLRDRVGATRAEREASMQSPFGRTCHGTSHRPEWLSFAEFVNRTGAPTSSRSPPEPQNQSQGQTQGQTQGRQRYMPFDIMFTKLGPSNIPSHLRRELGPDQDFIVDPSRSEVR